MSRFTKVFAAPFSTLARLHDKGAFETLVAKLGLPVPETLVVTSDDELREATGRFVDYFARAAFSRGGVCCLTNTGPLARWLDIDAVHPTPDHHGSYSHSWRASGLHTAPPTGAGELAPDVAHPPAAQAQHRYPV